MAEQATTQPKYATLQSAHDGITSERAAKASADKPYKNIAERVEALATNPELDAAIVRMEAQGDKGKAAAAAVKEARANAIKAGKQVNRVAEKQIPLMDKAFSDAIGGKALSENHLDLMHATNVKAVEQVEKPVSDMLASVEALAAKAKDAKYDEGAEATLAAIENEAGSIKSTKQVLAATAKESAGVVQERAKHAQAIGELKGDAAKNVEHTFAKAAGFSTEVLADAPKSMGSYEYMKQGDRIGGAIKVDGFKATAKHAFGDTLKGTETRHAVTDAVNSMGKHWRNRVQAGAGASLIVDSVARSGPEEDPRGIPGRLVEGAVGLGMLAQPVLRGIH